MELARLAQVFPNARNIVRAMPNTPGQIGAGVTGWCSLQKLSAEDQAQVETLLGALGKQFEVPESQMDALTALSGCGPAYLFEFAAALREGGIAAGLPHELAQALTIETLLGSSSLLAHRQIEPEILRNQVTSPNGVTFSGLKKNGIPRLQKSRRSRHYGRKSPVGGAFEKRMKSDKINADSPQRTQFRVLAYNLEETIST